MYKPAKPVKNIIIGAGPAGIQLGYFFQKAGIEYVILEKAEKAGSFFDKYPHSGKLISINKKHTGSDIEDFNLRHDWNSLLSEDGPKFTDYSDDFYPDSKDLTRYLNDFAEKFKLNIKYNTTVEKIRQKDNGYAIGLTDSQGKWIYSCEKLIVATGMGNPDMSDIEDTTKTIKHYAQYEKDYFKDPENLAEFNGKTILLIGNGNSSYELANLLTPHCGSILILGRSEKEWSMFSHYAGDLRSTYLGFHDTFLLKSLNAFDAQQAKLKIKFTEDKYTPTFICSPNCSKEHVYIGTPLGGFDSVILCTGWKFDSSIFEFELEMKEKYPKINGKFESSSYKNLFFIGSLMHSKDYKKSSGGFIHGFRYLIEYFFHINYDGKLKVNKFSSDSLENLAKHMLYKINISSPMYQMFGYMMDLIVYNPAKKEFTYINDIHREFLSTKAPDETLTYFTLSLEYSTAENHWWLESRKTVRDISMLGVKVSSLGKESRSTLIHPVLRAFKDRPNKTMIDEIHFDEELYAKFFSKEDYLDKMIRSLKMFI
jgi:hypothetical protein